MCGRYSLSCDINELYDRFHIARGVQTVAPRFNIAPTQEALIIDADNTLCLMQWGLIPSWSKDPKIGSKMINARAETVHEKPSFRNLLKHHRCLVLADGYYEWSNTGNEKVPYRFELEEKGPFALAGIWTTWQDLDTFTILTTSANRKTRSVHDRMPVILSPESEERWLDPEEKYFDDLLGPYPGNAMKMFPVTNFVNNIKNDSEECLQEAELISG